LLQCLGVILMSVSTCSIQAFVKPQTIRIHHEID
jgi:hypothetical protein